MNIAKLLHNPKAGDKDHTEDGLIALIESNGFECIYSSIKKGDWNDIEPEVDFLIVAGGDGTIRKVISKLLDRKVGDKRYPVALLPLGTANNISKSLNITGNAETIVNSWRDCVIKKFDVGKIEGLVEKAFFIEGAGFGVFPSLVNKIRKKHKSAVDSPDKEINTALELLNGIVASYKARDCKLEIDGADHSGKFLLLEVLNTPLMGPNLDLNPSGDPGDGHFEVILVAEDQREILQSYIQDKMNGVETSLNIEPIKARNIKITWDGIHMHVDDEIVKPGRPINLSAEVIEGAIDFVVPAKDDHISGQ